MIRVLPAPRAKAPPLPHHDFARVLGWASLDGERSLGFKSALPTRHVGVGVHDARTLLGLRAWRDACEGLISHGEPWVIFELEKLLRMLLRQSVLAMEILAALPAHDDLPVEELLSSALTSHMPVAIAQTLKSDLAKLAARFDAVLATHCLRRALTGALLAREQVYCAHLPTLLEAWDDATLTAACQSHDKKTLYPKICTLYERLGADHPGNSLPASPNGYDALHDYLISQRLGASR